MPADSVATSFRAGTRFTVYGLAGRAREVVLGDTGFEEVVSSWWGSVDRPLPRGRNAVAVARAVAGPVPRLPRAQSLTLPVYRRAGAAVLRSVGLDIGIARIVQSQRVDLDGNGTDEVLLTLRSRNGIGARPETRRGDYAGVLLRYLPAKSATASAVTDTPLILGAWPDGEEFAAPEDCELLACADIDGDGRLEIFVRTWYYEGEALTVLSFDGSQVAEALVAGWGL